MGPVDLVHRLTNNGDVVAFKMGRRQGGPSRTGTKGENELEEALNYAARHGLSAWQRRAIRGRWEVLLSPGILG